MKRRKTAFSPGEIDLLNLIRAKGTLRIKDIMRSKLFHGWDRDTILTVINTLAHHGMVDLSGEVVTTRHASVERVATRFLEEK